MGLRFASIFPVLLSGVLTYSQYSTDANLSFRNTRDVKLDSVSSARGNLFHRLSHHGPAVENPWVAYRVYFDKRTSVDVYSKSKPGLELREKYWYPSSHEQADGWGADLYKAGRTVGLGGIRLWYGGKSIPLHPVSERSAKIVPGQDSSSLEVFSKGVRLGDESVDILFRITVYSYRRGARVEAFTRCDKAVRFATGINYHKGLEIFKSDRVVATWGFHPEDVASRPAQVGAAIVFNGDDFEREIDDGSQILLVSKPTTYLCYWITSACEWEEEIHNFPRFLKYIENI